MALLSPDPPAGVIAVLDTMGEMLDSVPAEVFARNDVRTAVTHVTRLLDMRLREGEEATR